MCQKYALFMIHKNYMAPQFTKKQIRRSEAHKISPAQHLGLEQKILGFADFFSELRSPQQVKLPTEWQLFMRDEVPYPRMKRAA